jgi:hypothetical protein
VQFALSFRAKSRNLLLLVEILRGLQPLRKATAWQATSLDMTRMKWNIDFQSVRPAGL